MTGYVLDDSALVAGLGDAGEEHHRREFSRLLRDVIDGGPSLMIPALCLAHAAAARSSIADHIATIIAAARPHTVDVPGVMRTERLERIRSDHPHAAWPVVDAAVHAVAEERPVLTLHSSRYARMPLDALQLRTACTG